MADLNFPLNPQVNDSYTFNNKTFKYDGSKWRYVNVTLVTVTSGTAVTSINSLNNSAQDFAVGTTGSGFNISSTSSTHTFNIPIAGSGSTGLITGIGQTIAGPKTFSSDLLVSSSTASTNTSTGALIVTGGVGIAESLSVGNYILLDNGYGSVTTTPFASIFAKAIGSNATSLMQVKGNDGTVGMGMKALTGGNSLIYSNNALEFRIGSTIRDLDIPTGGTTYMSLGTTGVLALSSSTASTSTATGALTVSGGAGIAKSLSIGGRLQLFNGANYTAFVSSASGNTVYTLPATSPATGTSVLQSTSAGVLSWVPMVASGGAGSGTVYDGSLNSIPYYFAAGTAVTGSSNFTNTGTSINVGYTTAATNSSSGALTVVGGVGIGGSLYVAGDLTINGTTTTINTVTLTVDDKNIELGSVTSPNDTTAEGGGITLRGATDKSINWYTGTGWSSSENWNLVSGSTYKINNTTVLSNSSLGTGVTNSYLTALGTITTGVWSGTSITAYYGGTGLQTSFTVGDLLYANTASTWSRLSPGTNGFILVSAGTANTPTYTNPATLTIGTATTATNVNVVAATTSANHPLLFTPTSGSASGVAVSSKSTLVYNPSTDILSISGISVTSSTASTTTTTGSLIVTGGVGIGQSISVGGRLQLFNSANYTAFVSSATGNTVYTLPATSPATGSSVLQSTSAGVLSWVSSSSLGNSSGGTVDGTIQYKSGSGFAGTNSLFFDTALLGLRISGFPGGNTPASTDAVLKLESTIGSFNGSLNGTYIAVNAPTGFAGDLMNLQVNAVSKFRIDNTGAIIQNIGTNSTSTTSGAVQIKGGVGITGALFAGESINATSTTVSTSTSTGSLVVSGGAGFAGTINVGGTAKVFASTASTNTWTGALLVGGGVGISGQLTFAQASLGYTGITTNPSMSFIGNTSSSPITLTVLTDNSLNFEGSQGSVFSIDSNLSSGEIFSVSDISGLPIISASAGQTVTFNEFGGYTQFGNGTLNSSSTSTGAVVIAGGLGVTGNANIGGTARFTNTTASTSSTTGALTVSGGAGVAQTLFVGGSISNANYFYSGGNNFAKSGQAQGDILLDNNANDTPGVLYYYKNNTNFGTDVFATGTGSTRYRIVKDLNESGGSELWSIDRTGVVTQTAWAPGEIIKMTVLVGADLTGGSTTTISTNSDTDVASYSYTPVSSNSYLVIEFTTRYFVAGSAADDYVSRIAVDGAEQSFNVQVWTNGTGGGTRSGTLFPLMARYTNSNTTAKTISATVRKGTTDDNATVYKDTTTVMKITEIGR